MGIKIEFNPDLALRNFNEFKQGRRKKEECIPEGLEKEKFYEFLKEGHRNYWLYGEIPLLETKGNEQLSRPLASVIILEATHFMINEEPYTRGIYKVVGIFENNSKINFEGFARIKS